MAQQHTGTVDGFGAQNLASEQVARRRQEILQGHREKKAEEVRARSVERDDVLTLVLQKWPFTALLHYMQRYVMRVLHRRSDPLAFEECRFADDTLLEVAPGQDVSFCAYCDMVVAQAAAAAGRSPMPDDARDYYVMMMRACFLVALVHDTRVRQFVMAHHRVHELLQCRAPERARANAFISAVAPLVDDFVVHRLIPLPYMLEQALRLFHSEQFTLRRFSERPFLYQYQQHGVALNNETVSENIPHTGRPQISSTESRTGCDLSLIDELGY